MQSQRGNPVGLWIINNDLEQTAISYEILVEIALGWDRLEDAGSWPGHNIR